MTKDNRTRAWVSAARLRTLPLSVSGIIIGSGIAMAQGHFDGGIFTFAICTTIGFQVLSNFANDYGDGIKGTDNEYRIGPQRAVQQGTITPKEMKRGMVITTLITLGIAIALIYRAFGSEYWEYALLFLGLGIASVAAAINYTVGKKAYGYHGWGDVFVFLFFGLLSVAGCYFLYTKDWDWRILLPASSVGMLSTAVLNLNNMRDRESDAKAGKNTLVVQMGSKLAKYYHYVLILGAMSCAVLYSSLTQQLGINMIYLLAFIPLLIHLVMVVRNKDLKKLDPELKKVALSTFLFALLFAIGLNLP